MHVAVSLLLHSRKFWWYLLLASSILLRDVIMTSYCCQRYELVSGNDLVFQQDNVLAHSAYATGELLRQKTSNFLASNLWPSNSPDLGPVDYEIWAVMQHRVYHRQIHSVDELKRQLIDVWCGPEHSIFDAKGHFEYSLWTDNVDFAHICHIHCDLFDWYIFIYELMPASLANTFLLVFQASALADLRYWYGVRF